MATAEPERLEDLVNIGPKLAADLRAVGIPDAATLRAFGADEATRRLEAAIRHDCSHARRAIEGALAGVRWHDLPLSARTTPRSQP